MRKSTSVCSLLRRQKSKIRQFLNKNSVFFRRNVINRVSKCRQHLINTHAKHGGGIPYAAASDQHHADLAYYCRKRAFVSFFVIGYKLAATITTLIKLFAIGFPAVANDAFTSASVASDCDLSVQLGGPLQLCWFYQLYTHHVKFCNILLFKTPPDNGTA